jgi:hypothetical protein
MRLGLARQPMNDIERSVMKSGSGESSDSLRVGLCRDVGETWTMPFHIGLSWALSKLVASFTQADSKPPNWYDTEPCDVVAQRGRGCPRPLNVCWPDLKAVCAAWTERMTRLLPGSRDAWQRLTDQAGNYHCCLASPNFNPVVRSYLQESLSVVGDGDLSSLRSHVNYVALQ